MVIDQEKMTAISTYIEDHQEEALDFYRDLVNAEGRHGELEVLKRTAALLRQAFSEAGLAVSLIEAGDKNAPVVLGQANQEAMAKPIVFCCHYDTIYPVASYGKYPFRIEGDTAYGPGVADAKGGLVIALYTIKALLAMGFKEAPLRLIACGDEEVDHRGGKTVDIIKDVAKDALVAFNMEPRSADGTLCIGRMGSYQMTIQSKGRAAHSGQEFDQGINAIEELAHKIVNIQKLTPRGKDRDFTVSVDTVSGGSAFNQIPETATAEVDVRVKSEEVLEDVQHKIRRICEKNHLEGATTTFSVSNFMIPFATTREVAKAYNALKNIDDSIDGTVTGSCYSAGASDAAYIAQIGTPVVCQCGVTGFAIHTDKERASIPSLWEAIRLFICAAYNWRLFI